MEQRLLENEVKSGETISSSILKLERSNINHNESMSEEPTTRLLGYVQKNQTSEAQILMQQHENLNLVEIEDSRKYTLLHRAVLNNQTQLIDQMMEYIQDYYRRQNMKKSQIDSIIKNWVNAGTDEQYTALHFASYRGQVFIMEKLIKRGAKIEAQNQQGLGPLHVAAQGDQPISLLFFKQVYNLDFNTVDTKGGTVLHWACFMGSENTVMYLTSYDNPQIINLNIQDNEGLSALHLAVISGNSKIIKVLLTQGAKRNLLDNNGKTPAEIAIDNQFYSIEEMLNSTGGGLLQYYNIKSHVGQIEKSFQQILMFNLMYFTNNILTIIFILPSIDNIYIGSSYIILFVWAYIFYLIVCKSDCGVIPSRRRQLESKKQLSAIFDETSDISLICYTCWIIKPKRSKHCDICKHCVRVYDHHCPWVNTCIGTGNHASFYVFVLSTMLVIVFATVISVYGLFDDYQNINNEIFSWMNNAPRHYYYMKVFSISLNLLAMIIFLIPLCLLIYIQTNNLCLGQTTYQRFSQTQQNKNTVNESVNQSYNRKTSAHSDQIPQTAVDRQSRLSIQNQPDVYGCSNCVDMCWKNKQNKDYDYEPLIETQLNATNNLNY